MRAAQTLFVVIASLACTCVAACVREGAPVVAAVEVTDSDAGAASALVIATPPTPREQCSARLRALPIETGSGCTLDERISQSSGVLLYPCSGEGAAEAVFGEHRFQGRVTGSAITLALKTELDWEDHCHWETQQSIRGSWSRELRSKRAKLRWSYSEAPVSGTSCFGSCTAKADLEVEDLEH